MSEDYAAIYGRVSDEDKKGDVSVPMQLERSREYLKNQSEEYSYPVREYHEQKSAKDLNRDEMQSLISDIKKGIIRVVIVWKLDRLTRSVKDICYLLDLFEEHEVILDSVTETVDQYSPDGRFTIILFIALAERELGLGSKRTKDVLHKKSEDGKTLSKPVYGYIGVKEVVDGKVNVVRWNLHPEESENVKEMFILYDEEPNLSQLARVFKLSRQTVKNILTNPAYIGKRRYDGEILDGTPGFQKMITTEEIFYRVKKKLEE